MRSSGGGSAALWRGDGIKSSSQGQAHLLADFLRLPHGRQGTGRLCVPSAYTEPLLWSGQDQPAASDNGRGHQPRPHRRLVRRPANRTNPNIALRCSRRMTREFAPSVRSFIPLGVPDTIRSGCEPAGGPGQQASRQSPEAPETCQPMGCGPRENASAASTSQLPRRQEAHQEAT